MSVIRFGGDAGNSALKLVVEGLKEPIYIPSVYTEAVTYGVVDGGLEDAEIDDIINHLDVTITSPALKERKRLIIGNKVVNDGLEADFPPIDAKKAREEFSLVLLLTGLAAAATKLHPGQKTIRTEYEGSIALPVTQIQPAEAQYAEQRLMGSHTIVFHLPDGDTTVNLYIGFVKCAPEGAIAAYDLIYDYQGNVINQNMLEVLTQHFDIGAGTTDMPVTKGVQYLPQLSRGIKLGVAKAQDNIIHLFNSTYDYQIRSRKHMDEIYLNPNHPQHDRLKSLADPHLKQLANLLGTQFTNQLKNAQDVSKIVVHGGGSLIVRSHLQEIMSQRGYTLEFNQDPLYANARGLLKFTLSPRFARFKAASEVAASKEVE